MRSVIIGLASLSFVACGSTSSGVVGTASGNAATTSGAGGAVASVTATAASGTTGAGGGGGAGSDSSNENATTDDLLSTVIVGPTRLSQDDATLIGVTADDRIVYRAGQALWTIKAAPGAPARKAALEAGNVTVRGKTVFNFGAIDWKVGDGTLTYWTPKIGRRSMGRALIGDEHVKARGDDGWVLFARGAGEAALDVVLASADAATVRALVPAAARGGATTCAPSWGFAGDAAVVSWCAQGSMNATLARFAPPGWEQQIVTGAAQGGWSSDASGQHLFYVSSTGQGFVHTAAGEQKLGQGVGWGLVQPNGASVFFAVGDQLRRSDMASSPIPIVVDGFAQAVAWSPDFSRLLYSSAVVYAKTKLQDLRVTPTNAFNPQPTVLVADPVVSLGRSPQTSNAAYALYFTNPAEQGGTLNLRPMTGAPAKTVAGVDTIVAAAGSLVIFSDNRSGPGSYPVTADLHVVDAAGGAPVLLEVGILDGRDMQVTADGGRVAYARPGADVGGIWIRPVP